MKAGRLRHKVTLQAQATTVDSFGAPNNTWSTIAVRRASIEPLMGKEYYANSGEHSELTTRIRLRFDSTISDLRPFDRAVDASGATDVVYDIQSVQNPREGDREMVLMCTRSG
jgi:SPP1 family predicted phage head-tail adaptor